VDIIEKSLEPDAEYTVIKGFLLKASLVIDVHTRFKQNAHHMYIIDQGCHVQ
jgi:hypothetical protein